MIHILVFLMTLSSVARGEPLGFVPLPGTETQIAVHETTRGEFATFVDATGYDATEGMYSLHSDAFDWAANGDSWRAPGYPQSDEHPVVGVSLIDARAYAAWLTSETAREDPRFGVSLEYRLPTDAEWSLALGIIEQDGLSVEARMQQAEAAYPWGSHWPSPNRYGNYAGTESAAGMPSWWGTIPGGYTDAYPRTAPVGSFPANKLGIYDLSGNVWEWVDEGYTADSLAYVIRGGSWGSDRPAYLLAGKRNLVFPESRNDDTGFRLVIAPITPAKKLVDVLLQLDWVKNAQFAGPLIAQRDGLFREAGINLRIAAVDTDTLDQFGPVLESEALAIGVADGSALASAGSAGQPVRAFATMFQASPLGIMTLASGPVKDFQQLRGKRIGLHHYNKPQLKTMLASAGITLDQVDVIAIGDDTHSLEGGEIDAQVCYLIDEAVALETRGVAVRKFYGYQHGYRAYSQVYFTTTANMAQHRSTLKTLVEVSNEGWRRAFADPAAAADYIRTQFQPQHSSDYLAASLTQIETLVTPADGSPMASMRPEIWRKTAGMDGVDVDQLVVFDLFPADRRRR